MEMPKQSFLRRILQYLFDNSWLDTLTRAVFVEFTVYNANVNLFCCVTLTLETSGLGESHPSRKASPWVPTPIAGSCCLRDWGPEKLWWGSGFTSQWVVNLWVPDSKASVAPQPTVLSYSGLVSFIILRESSGELTL